MGQIANRQSLMSNERGQLSQAIPQFHVERVLHQWTPIARFESQRNERRPYEDQILCFRGRYERQRTLAIRIAAITLASWGSPKQPMKRQQPRNYDFWMFQFNLLGSQGGNSREMTTSPPGHYWEVTVALTTAAKLQQVRANSREMTSQKLNEEHAILRRFVAVVVSSAFKNSLILAILR